MTSVIKEEGRGRSVPKVNKKLAHISESGRGSQKLTSVSREKNDLHPVNKFIFINCLIQDKCVMNAVLSEIKCQTKFQKILATRPRPRENCSFQTIKGRKFLATHFLSQKPALNAPFLRVLKSSCSKPRSNSLKCN